MGKLGFIYPEIKKNIVGCQTDLGPLDMITPAGWNLVRAETVPAMQECYLRAMVTPLFPTSKQCTFSPLCWTLAILLELEHHAKEPAVNFIEMALIVQTTNPTDGLVETVDQILELRNRREAAKNKHQFDRREYDLAAEKSGKIATTFKDYADMNIRYLKATGMLQSKGKGIILIPEKRVLADQLVINLLSDKPLLELYRSLCNGTMLPTDNIKVASDVLENLLNQMQNYGIAYSINSRPLDTLAHINQVRYEIEELILEKKEEIYAREQATQWQEIAAYMDLIASRKDRKKFGEEIDLYVPRNEAPAYLEWCLWRAFLAIDTLANKPYEVRRFKIDQDFMPISTAPGNGPDLVAEFDDYVIVIEVTLSESSRQEAMEGEPVRRHVATLVPQYDKPVYSLFIANRIDVNTAETFRLGIWYTREDERVDLHIIPLTLTQFSGFFKAIFAAGNVTPQVLIDLMLKCGKHRSVCDAPQWKVAIESEIKATSVILT